MIDVSGLRFSYGGREVLKGATFGVRAGTVNFVLGANGAGKTTMFRCVLGLLKGYAGSVRVAGDDIKKLSPPEMARRLAYIPQAHSSVFAYTALDMTLMGAGRSLSPFAVPGARERRIAMDALGRVGAAGLAERPVHSLSGGERQLVTIARALAQETSILIMDEPTSSLDYGNQLRVLKTVRELAREGYTLLVSSHNPQHALTFADRALVMREGLIIADGAPGEVLTESLLRLVYGVRVHMIASDYGLALAPETDGV